MTPKFIASIFCITILLSACSIHKIDVQQGNVITKETLKKLNIGMGKKQVSRLLGTPLINDPFHKDRWDYIYYFRQGGPCVKKSVTSHPCFYTKSYHRYAAKMACIL